MNDQRRAIRDAYDEIAEAHDAERRSAPAPEQEFVADMAADLPDDAHVLDAGCGSGRPVAAELTEHVEVTGVDLSREQCRLARENAPGARIVQGDVTELPFVSNSFDALVSMYTIIHVPWDHQADCAREIHRVCRHDAPVLVTTGTQDWEGTEEDWMGFGAEMQWTIPGPERAIGLLDEAGFTVQGQATYVDPIAEEDGEMTVIQARA